jgi:hypothetical protein
MSEFAGQECALMSVITDRVSIARKRTRVSIGFNGRIGDLAEILGGAIERQFTPEADNRAGDRAMVR